MPAKLRAKSSVALGSVAAIVVALKIPTALAACALPSGTVPGFCSYSGTGAGLAISDSNTSGVPVAIEAVTAGSNGRALFGKAAGKGGIGGLFETTGAAASADNAAIFGLNSSGGAAAGNYGSAGILKITNASNFSPALDAVATVGDGIEASSTNGYGVHATGFSGVYGEATDSSGAGVTGFGAGAGAGVEGESVNGLAAYFTQDKTNVDCFFPSGTNWSCTSDRNVKEDFHAVDLRDVLHRLAAMPVWSYRVKHQKEPDARWLGPVAQDFRLYFGLGEADDTHINLGNEMGAALAAIKGLYEELRDRDAKIAVLEIRNAAQDANIAALADRLAAQESAMVEVKETLGRLAQGTDGRREAKLTEH